MISVAEFTPSNEVPGLRRLWAETLGDARICIAILDGPVDQSHPSLAGANLSRIDTSISACADGGPASDHGTHVASVIFGQHGGPVKGIAPHCRGLIVPIFGDGADLSIVPCSQLDVARAITQAVQAGASVINISGGELTPSGTAHPVLADAVRNSADANVLIIAAAGNEGCNCLHIPGALPAVLAVGAMDAQGFPLDVSNWGEKYHMQGVLAPGTNILGAHPGGTTAVSSGTSYATPIVSGVAALLLSIQLQRGQQPHSQTIRHAILSSAVKPENDTLQSRRFLAGRLNVIGAMFRIGVRGGGTMSSPEESESAELYRAEAAEPIMEDTPQPMGEAGGSIEGAVERARSTQPVEPHRVISHDSVSMAKGGVLASNRVHASTCDCLEGGVCSCGATAPVQLAFALGALGYDFGTEARRDSILQHMTAPANPYDPTQLLTYLDANPWDAAAILWTLNLDAMPIYVIQPQGAFASDVYGRLRDFLAEQTKGEVERVSIPGVIRASARLFSGQAVPVIWPDPRGMYSWNTGALVEAVLGAPPPKSAADEERREYARATETIGNFLRRVYDELRNLGITPQERAINAAATNVFQGREVFRAAISEGMDLDAIEVEPSPICRPESMCFDVKLTFFNPSKVFEQARKVYMFAFDVSDLVPTPVGPVRSWFTR
jgi:cyanobactin maturation PatA/PatG family protease